MNLDIANVATWLVLAFAAVGAAVVVLSALGTVTDPKLALSFKDYLEAMVIAAGGLAIGRGLKTRR